MELFRTILQLEKDAIIHPQDYVSASMPIEEVYFQLGQMEERGILTSVLETRCPYCGNWTGKLYDGFYELPIKETCPSCQKSFGDTVSENSYVVYQKSR